MPAVQGTCYMVPCTRDGKGLYYIQYYKIQCYAKFINLYWANWMPMSH